MRAIDIHGNLVYHLRNGNACDLHGNIMQHL